MEDISIIKNWTPEEILKLRKQHKLTRVKFGNLLGVTKTYIYYLETGQRIPSKILKLLLNFIEKQLQKEGGKKWK